MLNKLIPIFKYAQEAQDGQTHEVTTISLSQNPCDHCETLYECGESSVINEAEIVYEYVCFGKRCHMQLCHEHYLERKALDYEEKSNVS